MEGLWPLVIIWILFSVLGSRKKPGNRQAASGNRPPAGTLQDKFKAALEELQRAEREAMGQGSAQLEVPRPDPPTRPTYQPRQSSKQTFTVRRHEPKPLTPRKPAAMVPEPADDDDESSEDVFTPEGQADYDDEAEAIIARRRAAADEQRGGRMARSAEELTPEQQARRGARKDVSIGGKAEHDAWHVQMQATAGGQADKRASGQKNVLQRYADGSMKGALILAEILGKPKSS